MTQPDYSRDGQTVYYCPKVWEYLRKAHLKARTPSDRHQVPWELLTLEEQNALNTYGGLDCQGHAVLTFHWSAGSHPFEHEGHQHLHKCRCGRDMVVAMTGPLL